MFIKHYAWITWFSWLSLLATSTFVLILLRGGVDKAHVALIFMLIVLGGSAGGGRALGVALAVGSFLSFNWFFLLPYNTLVVANSLDWLVLIAFLVTGLVAAQLLYRARAERAAVEHAEALKEAGKLKDALLASVSHDLRTPLTTIKGLVHELSGSDERAIIIEEEVDRLNKMVADLLDLARLNGGALPLSIELNAVDDLLGALAQQTTGLRGKHRLQMHLNAPDGVLVGKFDFVHSLRILSNLVSNAFKYSPEDTSVDVIAGREENDIVIAVQDKGPGISTEAVERIFDPFYRPMDAPPDSGSAGLGLSIARRLAEAQNGTLSYYTNHGSGSIFILTLPAADIPKSL